MDWIVRNIKWIMIVSGALTCTMIYPAIAPQAALRSTYGETLEGPLADIIVRNWGALIAMVGGALIYGAFRPGARGLALVLAGGSKLVFIGLVLANGQRYLGQQVAVAIGVDTLMILLFAWYLAVAPRP